MRPETGQEGAGVGAPPFAAPGDDQRDDGKHQRIAPEQQREGPGKRHAKLRPDIAGAPQQQEQRLVTTKEIHGRKGTFLDIHDVTSRAARRAGRPRLAITQIRRS